ncbi:MAG: hypothetical protein ABIO99_08670 [Candidatus Limnocylindria bacterium]
MRSNIDWISAGATALPLARSGGGGELIGVPGVKEWWAILDSNQ